VIRRHPPPAQGSNLHTIQTLLGRADLRTTEIHTHVVKIHQFGVHSPVDDQVRCEIKPCFIAPGRCACREVSRCEV